MARQQRDPSIWIEMLSEIVMEEGDVIFQHDWDSGGPGAGAGSEIVYKFGGLIWPYSETEGVYGPMKTLEEALASGDFLTVTDATTGIRSVVEYDKELVAKLQDAVTFGQRDLDAWIGVLSKTVQDKGRLVFRHARNDGAASADVVYEFSSLYWPQSNTDGMFDPMDTLDDALAAGSFLKVTTATTSIDCGGIDSAELVAMLEGLDDSGLKWIFINGETWLQTPDGLFNRHSDTSTG